MKLIDIEKINSVEKKKENSMNNVEKEAIRSLCFHINRSHPLTWSNIDDKSIYIYNVKDREIVCKAQVYATSYSPMDASYYLYFYNKKYNAIASGIKDPNLLAVTAGDGYKFNWPDHVVKFIEKVVNIDDSAKEEPIMMKWEVRTPELPTYRAVDVIFNDPATIIIWADGSKTVVKAENEPFDPEKGLAMAISKKVLGNKYDYYDVFKKYVGRYEKKQKKGKK